MLQDSCTTLDIVPTDLPSTHSAGVMAQGARGFVRDDTGQVLRVPLTFFTPIPS